MFGNAWKGVMLVACAFALTASVRAQSAKEIVIHHFNGNPFGGNPNQIIRDAAGNFYGTAPTGGKYDAGVVFKVDAAGKPTVLHNFTGGLDGCTPLAPLIADTSGNLYGTASACGPSFVPGGSTGDGVVFMIDNTGHFKVLHSFSGTDGAGPAAALTLDPQGNLYGTTERGGHALGVIFRLSRTGTETVLHTFDGSRSQSYGNLIRDNAGNLYGIINEAGFSGTLFKLDPAGTLTGLYGFPSGNGMSTSPSISLASDTKGAFYGTAEATPFGQSSYSFMWKFDSGGFHVLYRFASAVDAGGVALDNQGNIYGTTEVLGYETETGIAYKLTPAGQFTTLYQFQSGSGPNGSPIITTQGKLYGTTSYGGSANLGALYEVPTGGQGNVIYSFQQGPDGCRPNYNGVLGGDGGLISDGQGNLYGATSFCGTAGQGIVFLIDNKGRETILHSFQGGSDGANPSNGLLRDSAGNLYGTTVAGGSNGAGTIFKLSSSGQETILHTFGFAGDGMRPNGSLIADAAGNLYGTTANGGTSGQGTVFKLDRSGNESVLYSFTGGVDGGEPFAGVTLDSAGNLYGTTNRGGAAIPYGTGVVYKLDPNGVETVLHAFSDAGNDGYFPYSVLIADSEGNLYGTTWVGGVGSCGNGLQLSNGTVFKIDPSGKETILFSFPCDGSGGLQPASGVIRDSAGNLYGTTQYGGSGGTGVVYKLDPNGVETVLYNFTGIVDDSRPSGELLAGPNGVLYGTTYWAAGEVFAILP